MTVQCSALTAAIVIISHGWTMKSGMVTIFEEKDRWRKTIAGQKDAENNRRGNYE